MTALIASMRKSSQTSEDDPDSDAKPDPDENSDENSDEAFEGVLEGVSRETFIEAYIEAFPGADVVTKLQLRLLQNAAVSSDGSEVFLQTSVPTRLLIETLREEADLPL